MEFLLPLGEGSKWEDNESRYMLRSLHKFFKEPISLTIYSNRKREWIQNANQLTTERFYPDGLDVIHGNKKYENYFDTNNKIKLFASSCNEDEFVYIYDDVVLLTEITKHGIINYTQQRIYPSHYKYLSRSRHGETILAAIACLSESKIYYNYETHMPRVYETDKARFLYRKFPLEKQVVPYSFATLYYNYFNETHLNSILDTNNYKAGFYGAPDQGNGFIANSIKEIDGITSNKVWVSYNDKGLNWHGGTLKCWIEARYQDKSIFEK